MEYVEPVKIKNRFLLDNLDKGNLVSLLDDLSDLTEAEVYQEIMELYQEADQSMAKWKKKYDRALHLASMTPTKDGEEIESKDIPFDGASLAMLPFITEAMLDFSGRAAPELVWADEIVQAKINGADTPEKDARQNRVQDYQNYQLTEEIPQWREQQDKGILSIPCTGTFYKKTYYDYEQKTICSDLRMADKVIFDHSYDSFELAPDKFEKLKYSQNEVIGFIRGQQEWNLSEDDIIKDDKKSHEFIEAHIWIDMDEDGLQEPYCAILHEETNSIVCIYPDYDEDGIQVNEKGEVVRIEDKSCYTQYILMPDPCGGPMGMGWGILLGPTFTAINQIVRDNIDAGTMSLFTGNSGLIATSTGTRQGNRQQSGDISVKMGQLTPVPMSGLNGHLRDNVVQFPFSGPSSALLELTQFMVETARNLTTAALSVDANPGEAASLYLARLQQGLKQPNSMVMRLYEAAKKEFKKIARLNYKHYDNNLYFKVLDVQADMRADFNPADCDIDLVADPSQGSDIERVAKAQNVYDLAIGQMTLGQQPVIALREAVIDLLNAQRVPDIERLVPEPPQGPSEVEQMMAAQQMAEMEFRKAELDLKNAKLELDRMEQAHKASKELIELGLKADLDEAEITSRYADALAKLVEKAGLTYDRARVEILRNEETFIDNERGVTNGERALPPRIPGTSGPVAQ